MSAVHWTEEELLAWIKEARVTPNDAVGYFEFLDAVGNMYYQKCLAAGQLPDYSSFIEAVQAAVAMLKTMTSKQILYGMEIDTKDAPFIALIERYAASPLTTMLTPEEQDQIKYMARKYFGIMDRIKHFPRIA